LITDEKHLLAALGLEPEGPEEDDETENPVEEENLEQTVLNFSFSEPISSAAAKASTKQV
jgi:hypothetical protein